MYVCGITPYDATHLGHAATMITFDLVNRLWRDAGLDVRYVQNVTDIDDPLLERAARDGEDWVVLAMRETALFREDMEALRIIPPAHYVGAVESIPAIAAHVARAARRRRGVPARRRHRRRLLRRSRRPRRSATSPTCPATRCSRLSAERGGDPERAGKRDPLDPLLWRGARDGEPAWDGGDLGPGRPGWHIECATIALGLLGDTIDVQGGGNDLLYPHHECSAAHAEMLTGAAPFAAPLRARRHDRPGRREDVEVQGQPGLRVPAARRRRRPDGGAAGPAGRPLPRRPRSGPTTCSRPASSAWPAGARPPRPPAGPSGDGLLAAVREAPGRRPGHPGRAGRWSTPGRTRPWPAPATTPAPRP